MSVVRFDQGNRLCRTTAPQREEQLDTNPIQYHLVTKL